MGGATRRAEDEIIALLVEKKENIPSRKRHFSQQWCSEVVGPGVPSFTAVPPSLVRRSQRGVSSWRSGMR